MESNSRKWDSANQAEKNNLEDSLASDHLLDIDVVDSEILSFA